MNIGQAAKHSGVSAKMIRYYEQIGLIPKSLRSESGYRHYSWSDAHRLCFICRARDLGFSVHQISKLLTFWCNRDRASADVKAMALSHLDGIKAKIAELQAIAQTLEQLTHHCQGNDRPDCPILADLAQTTSAAALKQSVQPHPRAPRFGIDTPASSRNRTATAARS